MGSAECLVVVDVRQGDGSDLRAVADIYRPLPGETIWFSWEDAPAPGVVEVGPHLPGDGVDGEPEGRLWVRGTDGLTKTADVVPVPEQRTRTLSADGGRYVWNQVDQPMVLMILPPDRTLRYVDPKPMCDGVWERNQRLCLFWGAPSTQTSYAFALGSSTGAVARNAKRWKRRTRSFRPTSRGRVLLGFTISLSIIFLVAGFIALRGQAEAGAWVGTVAALVSLFITVMQLLSTRQPNGGGLSNPA
jgi:hypothetical protein